MTEQAFDEGEMVPRSDELPSELLTGAQQYFAELHRLPPLSPEEYQLQAQRIRQYRQGLLDAQTGTAAEHRMLEAHLLQVACAAVPYARTSTRLEVLDLIQEANLAMLHAFQAYPFDEQGQFGKYLHKKVHWTLVNALYDFNFIRVPSRSLRNAQEKGQAEALEHMQPISLEQERARRG